MNIWVCELQTDNLNSSISINENNWPVVNRNTAFGYSTSPKEINSRNEGIVININLFNDLFLSNNNLRKETNVFNLAHEIGHYFGLYHPWSRVNNCNEADGDKVFDTPLTQNKNNFPEVNNNIIQTVCPPSTVRSNYQNFMDYSYHTGMFTKGQVARMRDQIKKYRPELLQQNSCPENAIGTTSGQQSTNPPNTQNQSGYADVCIKNKTRFKRRVVLTHRKSNYKKELLIALSMPPNPKTACTYDIPAGVYRCQVYTTITGSLIEDFEVRLNIGDNTPITITANGN